MSRASLLYVCVIAVILFSTMMTLAYANPVELDEYVHIEEPYEPFEDDNISDFDREILEKVKPYSLKHFIEINEAQNASLSFCVEGECGRSITYLDAVYVDIQLDLMKIEATNKMINALLEQFKKVYWEPENGTILFYDPIMNTYRTAEHKELLTQYRILLNMQDKNRQAIEEHKSRIAAQNAELENNNKIGEMKIKVIEQFRELTESSLEKETDDFITIINDENLSADEMRERLERHNRHVEETKQKIVDKKEALIKYIESTTNDEQRQKAYQKLKDETTEPSGALDIQIFNAHAYEANLTNPRDCEMWLVSMIQFGQSPENLTGYGACMIQYGKYDDARAAFNNAIALDPTYINAYLGMSELHLDRVVVFGYDERPQAMNWVWKADSINRPDITKENTYNQLANINMAYGELYSAEYYYQLTLDINPDNANALRGLDTVHYRMNAR